MKKIFLVIFLAAAFFTHAQNVGIGTTNPLAGLHVADSSVLFSAQVILPANPGNPPMSGAGRRMMWYADKGAFRAGGVNSTNWDKDNTGDYSIALGHNTRASALLSTAFGESTIASGLASTSMGQLTTASGSNATAMGLSSMASGSYSTAMGFGTTASNTGSTALGYYTIANGAYSVAMGYQTTASAYAVSAGIQSNAYGVASYASGANSNAYSYIETVVGGNNTVYTPASINQWNANDRLFVVGNGVSPEQRSNAVVVLKNGNTGIGNSTPGFPLNFANTIGDKISLYGSSGSNYGFGIQDNLLQIHASAVGEDIAFGYGSSASLTETMRIKGNGKVGIGITTPNAPLAFTNTVGPKISLYEGSANSQYGFAVQSGQLQLYTDAVAAKISFGYYTSGVYTERMYLSNATGILTVAGTAYPSDGRYKKQISLLKNPLEKINAINGVEYFMRADEFSSKHFDEKLQVGLIAQEVEKVLPQAVQTGEDGYKAVDYARIVPLLIEGMKAQQKQIDELKKLIEKLLNQ